MTQKIENPWVIGVDWAKPGSDQTVVGVRLPEAQWFGLKVETVDPAIDLRRRPDGVWEMPN